MTKSGHKGLTGLAEEDELALPQKNKSIIVKNNFSLLLPNRR